MWWKIDVHSGTSVPTAYLNGTMLGKVHHKERYQCDMIRDTCFMVYVFQENEIIPLKDYKNYVCDLLFI